MRIKKVLALAVALIMLISVSPSGFASENSLDACYIIQSDSIKISVNAPNSEMVTVVITDDADNFVIGQTEFRYLKEITEQTDGVFSCEAVMPTGSSSGKYYVTATTDEREVLKGNFWYMQESEAVTALREISNSTSSNFADKIGTYHAELGLDVSSFNAKSGQITKAFFKFKPNGDLDKKEFLTAYAWASLFGICTGESNISLIEDTFTYETNRIGSSIALQYAALDEQAKTEILGRFKKGVLSAYDPEEQIIEWICLADINNLAASSVENMKQLLFVKYDSVLDLDTDGYDDCEKKNDVIVETVRNRPYDSIDSLKTAFYNAVKKYSDKKSGGSGGSGGSIKSSFASDAISPNADSVFADVATNHWAYEQIKELSEVKIVVGREGNKFFPEDNVTRAEFSKIISEAFFGNAAAGECAFADVASGDWYFSYVAKLNSLGIVTGGDNGHFNPNVPITRQDAAVIIKRVCDQIGKNLGLIREYGNFNDESDIGAYAKDAVKTLYQANIINGMPSNAFVPLNNLTRAQAVTLVYLAMQQ